MSTQALSSTSNVSITSGDIQEYLRTYSPSSSHKNNGILSFLGSILKNIGYYLSCCHCCGHSQRKIVLVTSDKGNVQIPTSQALSALKLSDAYDPTKKVSVVFAKEITLHKLLKQVGQECISVEDLVHLADSNYGIQVERNPSSSISSLYLMYKLVPSASASGTAVLLCHEFNKKGDALAKRLKAEEEARAAELAQKQKAEEEARAAELAQKQKAEEEARAAELAQKQKAEEEARAAELAQKQKAEEEARAAELAQKQKAEEEARAAELAQRERAQRAGWQEEGGRLATEYTRTAPHRKEGRRAPTHQEDAQFLERPLTKAHLFTTFAFISKNAANLLRNPDLTYVHYLKGLDEESKMKLVGMAESMSHGQNTSYLRLIRSL